MNKTKKSIIMVFCLFILGVTFFPINALAYPDPGDPGGSPPPPTYLYSPPSPDYDGRITLTWRNSDRATRYRIYRSTSYYWGYQLINTTHLLSYTDLVLIQGYWYYMVKAYNIYGISLASNKRGVEVILPPQILPWGVDRIDAERIWGNNDGDVHVAGDNNAGQGINVLVIDTGIDYKHPDLKDNYVWGYNWVDNNFDPMDPDGHGTICAGVIAAMDNAFGIIGVAPKINLYAARVMERVEVEGFYIDHISVSDLREALEWAAFPLDREKTEEKDMRPDLPKMDIVSMSFGWNYPPECLDHNLGYWCDRARDAGVILVAAAGNNFYNDSYDILWPANYDSVISVGATDQNDQWAYFSCYDNGYLDVVAPGVNIISTDLTGYPDKLNGTSVACPHVAGICALILASNPNLTPSEVENILFNSAIDVEEEDWDEKTGYGLVNAYYALV